MKALLAGPPTVTIRDRIHWRKWPGLAACGATLSPAQQALPAEYGVVTCPKCHPLLKSWIPGSRFILRARLQNGQRLTPDAFGLGATPEVFGPFDRYDEATSAGSTLRRRMLAWLRRFGEAPVIDVVLDYRHAKPASYQITWVSPTPPHHGDNQGE